MHVHLSRRVYIDLDGAWTSPDTRARARRLGHNARREIRVRHATPLFFLLLFHPEVLGAPLRREISPPIFSLSRYFSRSSSSPSLLTPHTLSPSRGFFFPPLLHGQRFPPSRIYLLPFLTRAISPQYVPDSTLSRIYAFLSLLLLTYPLARPIKSPPVICERINFIAREEQVLKGTHGARRLRSETKVCG